MAEDKPRLARLTAILTQMQSQTLVTAREIAEKHHVSIRTVYRDIRTLEKSGIPVYTEEGKGYGIMDGYKLPPVMFTEEEAHALITAEQIISKNKDKSLSDQYGSAIEKIKATLRTNQKGKSELLSQRIEIRTNTKNEQTSNYLIQVQMAITNYSLLRISYLSLEKNATQREIEPYALVHTHENWILFAYCRLRQDFRAFRLDCIQSIHVQSESFKPHKLSLNEFYKEMSKKWNSTPDTPLT